MTSNVTTRYPAIPKPSPRNASSNRAKSVIANCSARVSGAISATESAVRIAALFGLPNKATRLFQSVLRRDANAPRTSRSKLSGFFTAAKGSGRWVNVTMAESTFGAGTNACRLTVKAVATSATSCTAILKLP